VSEIARTPVSVEHDNHGDAYFAVGVRLDTSGRSSTGAPLRLRSGMSAKAEFVLERRSLFELIQRQIRDLIE
jgi:multidrug efflux pump subunit AcrA (membrane-fusion protein)